MGVPPTRQPPSTPASSGGQEGPSDDRKVKKKEFKMPDKAGKKKEKEIEIAGEPSIKEMKQEVAARGAELKAEETSAITSKAQVSQIGQLIQRMVAEMRIGMAGGKEFASLTLAAGQVPDAFAGSNLTLSYAENKLVIKFENFTNPQNEQRAFILVEQNKEQLTQMVQALQARNIQVTEMNIGTHSVTLPRVEPLPPPFQAPPSPEGEGARREGERRPREGREEPE